MDTIEQYFPKSDVYNYANLEYFIDHELSSALQTKITTKIMPYLKKISNEYLASKYAGIQLTYIVRLTRLDVAGMVASSFLCKIENKEGPYGYRNFHKIFHKPAKLTPSSFASFDEYMNQLRINLRDEPDPDEINNLSIEKMKFIFGYFNYVYENRYNSFFNQNLITFVRSNKNNYKIPKASLTLSPVEFRVGSMDDINSRHFKVNFANKNIGGKVLSTGCRQEEIKFLTNPELIACLLMSDPLSDTEVITITGAIRYSKYVGYGYDLRYTGGLDKLIHDNILEMDALQYTPKTRKDQYLKTNMTREIQKASIGFAACSTELIITGGWGTGAFHGDPLFKFMIQLYAASINQKKLVYCLYNQSLLPKLTDLMKDLSGYSSNDLLEYLDSYGDL